MHWLRVRRLRVVGSKKASKDVKLPEELSFKRTMIPHFDVRFCAAIAQARWSLNQGIGCSIGDKTEQILETNEAGGMGPLK